MEKFALYLRRVIWPAIYITALAMIVWLLGIGGTIVVLMEVGYESAALTTSLIPTLSVFVVMAASILALCLILGHIVYRLSNGTEWLELKDLIPRSFLKTKKLALLVGILALATAAPALAITPEAVGTIVGGRALPASLQLPPNGPPACESCHHAASPALAANKGSVVHEPRVIKVGSESGLKIAEFSSPGGVGGLHENDSFMRKQQVNALKQARAWLDANSKRIKAISLSVTGNYYARDRESRIHEAAGFSTVTILYEER